jgi:transcriptional regulator GlxA family with amidase domain
LNARGQQNVTEIMLAVGIANFGRFAQYYRQQIGESPSTTLKRGL